MQFPIHIATFNGFTDILNLFIKNGDNVNKAGNQGKTPLHYASEFGYLEIIQLLALHGADPRLKSINGLKPIDTCYNSYLLKLKQNTNDIIKALTKAEYDIMQKERLSLEAERLLNFLLPINTTDKCKLFSLYNRK